MYTIIGTRRMEGSMSNKYIEILKASTKLGLTSFGGPSAHIGYFHEEYVNKRKWLDDKLYADIVALCQFLPGPASSQVGISIGLLRGGIAGGIISFLGFTLPSVLILMLFAAFVTTTGSFDSGWIQGLKIVAVAVVAHALLGDAKKSSSRSHKNYHCYSMCDSNIAYSNCSWTNWGYTCRGIIWFSLL